jgi:putative PIG3 family NAD(P)H quinone oxidoreductase
VLELGSIEIRDPGPGEVLVRIAAAGLNRADLIQRRGLYPAPPGAPEDVPGLEYAGTVEAVGVGVDELAEGQHVMGILGGGAMATHAVVPAREVVPVPASMALTDAAAVPEAFFTAYDALVLQGELAVGQVALIHAVGSGVGTAALQVARLAGATVVGTSRTEDKLSRCRDLGLENAVQVQDASFADAVRAATEGRGADVVLDLVGAAYLEENLRAVASCGRILVVGLTGGISGSLPLAALLKKRAHLIGTVLRSRPSEEKAALAQRFARELLPAFESGKLRPVVSEVLPMEQVAEAHRRMEANATFGKIVLSWGSSS